MGYKLRAYQLQDGGRGTVDANLDLGLPVDGREYGVGAAILTSLDVDRIRLITTNPSKYSGLGGYGGYDGYDGYDGYGITLLKPVASTPAITAENIDYLGTKRDRMGHLIDLAPAVLA